MLKSKEGNVHLSFGTNKIRIDPGAIIDKPDYNFNGSNNSIQIFDGVRAFNLRIQVDGDGNEISIRSGVRLKNCTITIKGNKNDGNFRGHRNTILIYSQSNLSNVFVEIKGTHNQLVIEERVTITKSSNVYLHGFGCAIEIGYGTSIQSAHLAANEIETAIEIGNDCLLSDEIFMQTGDSHPIYDNKTLKRTNAAQNILVGNHVWVGARVLILKGAKIPNCSIVAAGSIMTNPSEKQGRDTEEHIKDQSEDFQSSYSIFVGQPMKVAKHNVAWSRDMFYDNDEVLVKYPDAYAQSWFRKGVLFVEKGYYSKEKKEAEKAISYFEKAINSYQNAIKMKSDYVYAHCALGNAYILLNSTEHSPSNDESLLLAKQSFTNAINLDPNHTDSSEGLKAVKKYMRRKPRNRGRSNQS